MLFRITHWNPSHVKNLSKVCCRYFLTGFWNMNDEVDYHFAQRVNPLTGKYEWIVEHRDEHDYFTDIARSSYADMLHDTERNQLYYQAIKLAVNAIHARGEECRVLDIGTGTGLLSMMAAKAGAEVITAIEVFNPVAELAKKITSLNGFQNISIVNKHSTEVTCGLDGDMKERANLLVTELFDTELIGEGALTAYQHAHEHLMEKNCLAVPHKARTYAQVVESPVMFSWHKLVPCKLKTNQGKIVEIHPNSDLLDGNGVPAVHDIQLSQFPSDKFTEITDPIPVFEFNWNSSTLTDESRCIIAPLKAKTSGTAQVILSWWDLDMDSAGEIVLSTAPRWHHPNPNKLPWRDHWIQSVYFLPNEVACQAGDDVVIKACHDAFSMWFDVCVNPEQRVVAAVTDRPSCDYPPRLLWSRRRLGMLNDADRNRSYANALENVSKSIPAEGRTLCVSDFGMLPLLMAQICDRKVVALEQTDIGQRGLIKLARRNNVQMDVVLKDSDELPNEFASGDDKIGLLAAEPFLRTSDLPWTDLNFWYTRSKLQPLLHPNCKILPQMAYLCLAAVQFDDLWKIRAPVGKVEGFDVSLMDQLIASALEMKEIREAESQPLWEYPNVLLTKPTRVLTFDFRQCVPEKPISDAGRVQLEELREGKRVSHCHGVVLWMEYNLDGQTVVSTGLDEREPLDLHRPSWSMHHKQAVFFLRQSVDLRNLLENKKMLGLNYDVQFLPHNGEMRMDFEIS